MPIPHMDPVLTGERDMVTPSIGNICLNVGDIFLTVGSTFCNVGDTFLNVVDMFLNVGGAHMFLKVGSLYF